MLLKYKIIEKKLFSEKSIFLNFQLPLNSGKSLIKKKKKYQ
jgi:hypothetical protein